MNKALMKKLQNFNTPENFYKLAMWVAAAAGEGLCIGNCDAAELLYCDILSDADDSVFDKLDRASDTFVNKYKSRWVRVK